MAVSPHYKLGQPVILGFDPGRDKCGLAIVGLERNVLHHEVVLASSAIARIKTLQSKYPISLLVMGDQTTSKEWKQKLSEGFQEPLRIVMVDERNSTLEARDRYWQMHPPKGIFRLVPQGIRTIPKPIDDIVAILLIERYLNNLTQ
jgi:RNase H-fold protein (predicted Holliday junction resolvase)